VLRALDTVEDDMTVPIKGKVEELKVSFQNNIFLRKLEILILTDSFKQKNEIDILQALVRERLEPLRIRNRPCRNRYVGAVPLHLRRFPDLEARVRLSQELYLFF